MAEELKDSKLVGKLNLVDMEKIGDATSYSSKEESWDRANKINESKIRGKAWSYAENIRADYFRIKNFESRLHYGTNFIGLRKKGTESIITTSNVYFYSKK